MAQINLSIAFVAIVLLITATYCITWRPWSTNSNDYGGENETRDIIEKMRMTGRNFVVFYGSQSGTAEDFACRLAQEGKSRYGLETMVADLEDYDYDNLDMFPENNMAIFVLSTYGEGEPTDNASNFYNAIADPEQTFSESRNPRLAKLKYNIFGLGNSTYEHYNLMSRNVNKALEHFGAQRIGEAGEGNAGKGTMEEDFIVWKDGMWAALRRVMSLTERAAIYEPKYIVTSKDWLTCACPGVYLGEPNRMQPGRTESGPYTAQNPYIASVAGSKELFRTSERNCVQLEIDINGSGLNYDTGDHVAIWPVNPENEVDELVQILGLEERRDAVIDVKAIDPTVKVPFPTPTTFATIFRHRLAICAPVSRQFLVRLADFAPNNDAKTELAQLGYDKTYFHDQVGKFLYTLSRTLKVVSGGEKWTGIPLSVLIESLPKLQPRYYSISSSSLVQPKKILITAVVEKQAISGRPGLFMGVASNYLLAIKQKQNIEQTTGPHYEFKVPRHNREDICIPIHIRSSNFKLPHDVSQPLILIGPGTGVAPMRAFVQERAEQALSGRTVGRTLLFFGCRRREEDFLYESEWLEYKKVLGDRFEMITAFSREGAAKVYVQHRLKDHAGEVSRLVGAGANLYVCGNARNMAQEVKIAVSQIISDQRGILLSDAQEMIKTMKASGNYLEDVW